MDHTVTALERAFQLAKSGRYTSITELKKQLGVEGYAVAQVSGRNLLGQLYELMQAARAKSGA
jgi:hypothetical protein